MKQKNKQKGITLIALVITIIVLLILAGISISTLFGENGLLVKAQLAAFATEMKQIEENVHLKLAEYKSNSSDGSSEGLFNKQLNGNDITIPDTLKQEILYVQDGMPDESSPKDYNVEDFNKLLDAEGNVGNIYIVDKETGNGKENTYVYDETTDTVYKIPQTNIGGQIYHSYECAEKGKGGEASGETGAGGTTEGTIDKESDVIKVGEEYYYAPNMKGFNSKDTYLVYYSDNFEEEKDIPVEEYIKGGELANTTIEGTNYKLHDYGNAIWANAKTVANDLESWWVWIPRYAYKVNGQNDSTPIDVIYIGLDDKPLNPKYDGTLPEGYEPHPAFSPSGTDGSKNLKGIWMSKYEPSLIYQNRATTEEYYAPDMTGFDKEHTYIELYDSSADEFIDQKKLSEVNLNTINNEKKWYDYQNNIWANIKTDANDLESWWVWVPRYAYKIEITGVIDIIYIDLNDKPINTEKYGKELPEGYTIHPAFAPSGEDGSKNLKGIWMSKYESSLTYQNRATTEEYYAPDMTGFDKEYTYIELYDSSTDEFIDQKKLSEVDLSTINNEKKWYDYQSNIWANIKTTAHDLESWWVWVPRYAYKIEITGVIDIIYIDLENKPMNKEKYGEELPEGYIVHPAFTPKGTDGEKNLKGIWMSKYEPSDKQVTE